MASTCIFMENTPSEVFEENMTSCYRRSTTADLSTTPRTTRLFKRSTKSSMEYMETDDMKQTPECSLYDKKSNDETNSNSSHSSNMEMSEIFSEKIVRSSITNHLIKLKDSTETLPPICSLTPTSDDTHVSYLNCANSCSSIEQLTSSSNEQNNHSCCDSGMTKQNSLINSKEKVTEKPKDLIKCQWSDCLLEVPFIELLDHITTTHVKCQQKRKTMKEQVTFACKWEGCKVYNKPSTLYTWLEKHVICHLGNKPYRCIVENCGMRFASQVMLNRHVNKHFTANLADNKMSKTNTSNMNKNGVGRNKNSLTGDGNDVGTKPPRKRRSRKVKTRQAPSAIQRDLFDSLTMNCIQKYLVNFSKRTQVQQTSSGQIITFHSQVIGCRTDAENVKSSLIRWYPNHILPDKWVLDSELPSNQTQVIPLAHLSGDAIKFLMCHQD